jgi:extradiol dioxygenase family protein
MPTIGLSHYNIQGSRAQLHELRDFYCAMAGLVEGPRPPFLRFGYWLYAGAHAILHLIEIPSEDAVQTEASAFIDHVAFNCSDFEAMKARLDSGGIDYRLASVPEREQRQLFFKDPLGNGIELIFEG